MPLLESTSNWQKHSSLWKDLLSKRLIHSYWRRFTYLAELTIWFIKSITLRLFNGHTVTLHTKASVVSRLVGRLPFKCPKLKDYFNWSQVYTELHTTELSCTWTCGSAFIRNTFIPETFHHHCCIRVNISPLKNSHCHQTSNKQSSLFMCRMSIIQGGIMESSSSRACGNPSVFYNCCYCLDMFDLISDCAGCWTSEGSTVRVGQQQLKLATACVKVWEHVNHWKDLKGNLFSIWFQFQTSRVKLWGLYREASSIYSGFLWVSWLHWAKHWWFWITGIMKMVITWLSYPWIFQSTYEQVHVKEADFN